MAYKDRVPYLYVEQGTLRVQGSSVVLESEQTSVDVPVRNLACLLLGPGTNLTHAAAKACAAAGTILQWVGEEATAAYAVADPLVGDPERLRQQVLVSSDQRKRMRAIRHMFSKRFAERASADLDEDTLRGMEGARVKRRYAELAELHKLPWDGRRTGRGSWGSTDLLNQAISVANGHLMQVATVAVLAAGYSPAIGFLHAGFNRAFACDVADLHKFDVAVPLAFKMTAAGMTDVRTNVRRALRDEVRRLKLIDQMISDAIEVVSAGLRPS